MVTASHPAQPPSAPITLAGLLRIRCFSRQYPQPGEALSGGRTRGRGPGDDLHLRVVGGGGVGSAHLFHRQPGPLPAGSPDRTIRHLQLPTDVANLLFGGMMLHLATFAFTRWQLFHTIAMPRLSATVVVLALFLLATQVWALVSVVLLTVTPGVLNALESRVLPKTLRQVTEPG